MWAATVFCCVACCVVCGGIADAAEPAPRMLQSQDSMNATAAPDVAAALKYCAAIVSRGLCEQIGDLCPVECQADSGSAGELSPERPDQICSAIASSSLICTPMMSDLHALCPVECGDGGGAGAPAPDMVTLSSGACSVVASSGACNPTMSDLCPAACSAGAERPPAPPPPDVPPPGQPIATSCAVLIELDGGCAHDLSLQDPAAAPGTRVSDVCPEECNGHGGCTPTAADVSFLEVARDSSGHGVEVELGGDACVDGSGVLLSGGGWAELAVGSDYINDGACTVSFWLLKGAADVLILKDGAAELLFSHPAAEAGGDFLDIFLLRSAWYDHYTLWVHLGTAAVWSFAMDAHRDAVPMWTHLSIVVDGNAARLYRDGARVPGTRSHGLIENGAQSSGWSNGVISSAGAAGLVHGPWGNDVQHVERLIGLPPGSGTCHVSWRSWSIDSRDREEDRVIIDGEKVWASLANYQCDGWSHGPADFPLQHWGGSTDVCYNDVRVHVPCSGVMSVRFESDIDQPISDEAWAFSSFSAVKQTLATLDSGKLAQSCHISSSFVQPD